MSILIFIIILVLLLLFLLFLIIKSKKQESFNRLMKSTGISVIILSHNRPHNLSQLLPTLSKYELVSEIIILHGLPKFYQRFDYPKVINIKDFKNNYLYGSARRFLCTEYIKKDVVLFLDDDILPSETYVKEAYDALVKNYNKNTIFGSYKRYCNHLGYDSENKKYDTILTAGLMCKKDIIVDYKNTYFDKFKTWFIKYNGNCEDLSLNLFVRKYYKEYPVFISGEMKEFDKTSGHSSKTNHYIIRDQFCKKNF